MIIIGLVVFSFLILMAILLITVLFGAAARESEKDMQLRTEMARLDADKSNVSPTDEPYRDPSVPT